jgi:hypothetical protein
MAGTDHNNLSGAIAIHPAAYVQSTDPGAVGAHKFWMDTSTGAGTRASPYTLKKRNAANSGWELFGPFTLSKLQVRVASTANVNTSSPGASIDGVSLTANDRVLLHNQTAAAENGIWVWNGAAVSMTRASDASAAADFLPGDLVFVKEGTANAGTNWQLTTSAAITVGTTSLTYAQVGGAGSGTVTSVALTMPSDFSVSGSPVTGSGTLAVTAATQTANTVKAGPTTGAAAAPTYRALVAADIPTLNSTSTNQLAADVTMTSANTYYDGPSLTLTAGTYLLMGHVTCMITGNSGQYTAKLWDGTTVTDSAAQTQSSNTFPVSLSVYGVVSPTGSTTYKISVASGTAAGKILAAAPTNAAGNTASTLIALKLAA